MIVYSALGDSITAGEGATIVTKAFPFLIAAMLRSGSQETLERIMAHPGWTSSDLLGALMNNPSIIRRSTMMSIWVGGDDLIQAGLSVLQGASQEAVSASLLRYKTNLGRIVQTIRSIGETKMVLCTQYNPFPKSPIAVEAIKALNKATIQTSKQFRTMLAPTHVWFEGKQTALIAEYQTGRIEDALQGARPIHPNNRGHRVIAEKMLIYFRQS